MVGRRLGLICSGLALAVAACSAQSGPTTPIASHKTPPLCQQWRACAAALAKSLGAPVLVPPPHSSDRLMSTHVYPGGGIAFNYFVGGRRSVMGIVSASPLRRIEHRPTPPATLVTRTTFRGQVAWLTTLPGGHLLDWDQYGRTWQVSVPSSVPSATVYRDVSGFRPYPPA